MTLALVAGALLAVPVLLWRGLVTLPHRYDDLRAHGVNVSVQVTRCGTGLGGDSHEVGCRVRLEYGAYSATWKEGDLRGEESPGGTVPGLVDPHRPQVHALAVEVAHRSGAGVRGPEVFAAFLAALVAAAVALLDLALRPARGGR